MMYTGSLHVISQVGYSDGKQENFVASLMRATSKKDKSISGVVVFLDRESAQRWLDSCSDRSLCIMSFLGADRVARLIKGLMLWSGRFKRADTGNAVKEGYILIESANELIPISILDLAESIAKQS